MAKNRKGIPDQEAMFLSMEEEELLEQAERIENPSDEMNVDQAAQAVRDFFAKYGAEIKETSYDHKLHEAPIDDHELDLLEEKDGLVLTLRLRLAVAQFTDPQTSIQILKKRVKKISVLRKLGFFNVTDRRFSSLPDSHSETLVMRKKLPVHHGKFKKKKLKKLLELLGYEKRKKSLKIGT